ncbi:hypothetical protein [Streptomyces sp. NBC_00887]|nr:hypothetical protein OG844_01700 [Streptomyces sp. NBC_00887]WSY36135.1 hypothetical protein OG844_43900 [Streptomyces sp. NBC_00887]
MTGQNPQVAGRTVDPKQQYRDLNDTPLPAYETDCTTAGWERFG